MPRFVTLRPTSRGLILLAIPYPPFRVRPRCPEAVPASAAHCFPFAMPHDVGDHRDALAELEPLRFIRNAKFPEAHGTDAPFHIEPLLSCRSLVMARWPASLAFCSGPLTFPHRMGRRPPGAYTSHCQVAALPRPPSSRSLTVYPLLSLDICRKAHRESIHI
jgi:hypothetical protein